jgi:hypothetical protein
MILVMRRVRSERPRLPADLAALGLLVVAGVLVVWYLRDYLSRPLWFDEQWRAYHITARGLGFELTTMYAPVALGWLLLERGAVWLLGSHEVALRAPMALMMIALPLATFWLARRWLGPVASALTGGTLLLNGAVLGYGLQLKPFMTDALVVVLMVALWAVSHQVARWRPAGYAAIGVLSLCSIAALFVLVPLLAFDLVVAVRARRPAPALALALALAMLAGAPALAHLALFVRAQTLLLSDPRWQRDYWQGYFVPHRPGAAADFLGEQLMGYLPRLLTGAAYKGELAGPFLDALPGWLVVPAAAAAVAALALGARSLLGTTSGRGLLVATAGALVLQAVASWMRLWPFGFVRVNVFLVPLLWVILGVGVADALAGRAGRGAPGGTILRAAGAVSLAVLAAVAAADARAVRDFERQPKFILNSELRAAVTAAREAAGPGTLAIVDLDGHHRHGPRGKGWVYYMDRYDGDGDRFEHLPRIPPGDTIFLTDEHPEAARPFLDARPTSTRVVVYLSYGVSLSVGRMIRDSLAEAGYTRRRTTVFPRSGRLSLWIPEHPVGASYSSHLRRPAHTHGSAH